jgi:hypothetical protein
VADHEWDDLAGKNPLVGLSDVNLRGASRCSIRQVLQVFDGARCSPPKPVQGDN